MNTTQAEGAPGVRAHQAAHAEAGGVPAAPATFGDLTLLESAHEQLLRQVHDLRRAYEAERRRRARLTESAFGFMTTLARTAPTPIRWALDGGEAVTARGA